MERHEPPLSTQRLFRMVVLDIDGTLLDPSDVVRPVVRAAIAECRQLGVPVALATGRRLCATRPVLAELGLPLPLVLVNGALVWDAEREEALAERPLARQALARALAEAEREGLGALALRGLASGERLVLVTDPLPALPEFERELLPRTGELDRLPAAAVVTCPMFSPSTFSVRSAPAARHGPPGPRRSSRLSPWPVRVDPCLATLGGQRARTGREQGERCGDPGPSVRSHARGRPRRGGRRERPPPPAPRWPGRGDGERAGLRAGSGRCRRSGA
jgi:hypothetical protein